MNHSIKALLFFALFCNQINAAQKITAAQKESLQPNVLFIAMDDLNDWIGCMGGHPQSITPNLNRLAASGILFTNAHCPAPACNPSRSAIFTGRAPNRSGLYDNRQQMREIMPGETIMPHYFRQHGYFSAGSGKLLHYFIDAKSWDEYFPKAESENPFPETFYPKKRPVSLERGGPWQYVETDWAALDVTDEEFGGDWSVSKWIGEQLIKKHDKPFFLGCGLYRPHEPWFVPKKYFEPFPLESIQLPPGYRENDLDDVPEAGQKAGRNKYFAHIQQQGKWRQGIQGYLASIHFADAMLGRVLDALESGPNANNTIVVLWSDHGWQLGEKEHWQKFTPWRAVTRVPLMVRVPSGASSVLPKGTQSGAVCDAPVNLLSLFPTLTDLCKLPGKPACDGPSLLPLLVDPLAVDWNHDSVTFLAQPGTYAVSGRSHRYIHYADGGEELYDISNDPFEWTNLVNSPESHERLASFRKDAPRDFAQPIEPSIESLTKLTWHPTTDEATPVSKPDGNPFPVHFINKQRQSVELCWMSQEGQPKSYGLIASGNTKTLQSRPGAVWSIRKINSERQLGYFVIGDRTAQAVIPAFDIAAEEHVTRPNVVFIVVDDLGYGELGCYGGRDIPTPHIDALATGGARFTSGYVTAPFCAASRAALITGRYQTRFGFEFNPIGAKNAAPGIGLPAEEQTIAQRLRDSGYATALVGKWHLGGTAPFHPQRRGFDEFFGFLHEGHFFVPPPWNGVTTWLRRKTLPDGSKGRWTSPDGRILWSTDSGSNEPEYDTDNPLLRSSQPVDERDNLTDAFTREACDFIHRHRTQPFFLSLNYNAVHSPMQAVDSYLARFAHIENTHRRIFAGMLAHLDDSIGKLIAQIRESGVENNTLVIFLSDNGGPTKELTSSNAPLRGGKGDLWEGGIRVPFIISWTGRIPSQVVETPVTSLDASAIALGLAGESQAKTKLDGVNLMPLLTRETIALPERSLFWRVGRKNAMRSGNWKLIRDGSEWQLYDLANDIGESIDVSASQADRVKQLSAIWDKWNAEQIEPLWR